MKRARRLLGILLAVTMLFSISSQSVFAEIADSNPAAASSVSPAPNVSKEDSEDATSNDQVDKEGDLSSAASEEKSPVPEKKQNETLKSGEESDSVDGSSATSIAETSQSASNVGTDQSTSTSEASQSAGTEENVPESSKKVQTDKNTVAYNTNPITGSKTSDGVTVQVNAPVESFPEGTDLTITPLSPESADEIAESILSGSEAVAFDISFLSTTGEKIQPANGKKVKVTFVVAGTSKLAKTDEEQATLRVYHIKNDNSAEHMANVSAPAEGKSAEVSVDATQFSPYLCLKAAAPQLRAAPAQNEIGGVDAGAHVHCTVTTENTAVSNGQYVSFAVKYQVDHGSIHEDDYITVKIPDSLKNVDLQLDPKHFKGYEKQADGSYHLIFNDNADGIAGSFSLNATASNETTSAVTATVDVNGTKSSVTISGLTPSGIGIEKAIEKSAYDGSSIQYGGYDYSTGSDKDATEIGIYTPSSDVTAKFHIDVNHNGQEMWNVSVTDDVPMVDGVIYNNDLQIDNLNGASFTNHSNANHISVSFDHLSSDQQPRLTYTVTIKAGTTLKINNNAVLDYTSQTGENETVIDRFQLKPGNGYSAADAYKSVDKTVVSGDPEDQTVKYTITFDPDKEFAAGELRLEDKLNEYVKYLYSYGDSAYDVSYDEATHTVHMVNNQTVDGNRKRTVTIVTDFSNVPEGTDVTNTVGNTVHTLKYKGELELHARKTVDGAAPGNMKFEFQLMDEAGQILQSKENDAQGNIVFDKIYYDKEDLGKEHTYTVKESSDADGFTKDEAVYTIKVTPKDEDQNGILEIDPEITKDGQAASDITFDNKKLQGKLEIRKTILGDLNLAEMSEAQKRAVIFEITGPDQYSKTVTLADMEEGILTLSDLAPGTYMVKETGAELPGYTVETTYGVNNGEAVVESGKTAEVEISNKYTPETTSVSGTKTWEDNNNQDDARPDSITIRLLANGKEVDTKNITAADKWAWTFKDLPKYENGEEITYTITEDVVEGYTTDVNGYDVTNTHTPGKTSVAVTKAWNDDNNQDGKRPTSVTVRLLADGEDTGKSVELSEANNWSDTFKDLDEKKAGKAIVYTVEEAEVAGYTVAITGDAKTGFTVTNTHKTETTDISGTKTWSDNNNQDGARPDSITIRLLANGKEVDTKNITAADKWAWTFKDLPKYENGEEITYTITEDVVEGYTTDVNGYDVTNTHTPGKTSVAVTKAWNDDNNQDGKRPTSVTVRLLADGEDTGKTVELSEANNWSGTFKDLDEKKAGKVIVYTVEEAEVAGYTVAITGDAKTGYTVTNTHKPETTSVSGTKTWNDNNDQDGARPDSITIRLLANGKEVDTKNITAADKWAWTFNDLPKYKDGVEITYSVKEDAVTDYSTSYDGANVTNTHTPGQTSISVSKVWNDRDNQDRIRPKSATIHLLADGKDTGKVLTLNGENQWTGSFTNLDLYANGEKINYSVTEDAVSGYQTSITGDETKGFTVVNTHTPDNKPPKPVPPTDTHTPNNQPSRPTPSTGSRATRTGAPKTGDSANLLLYGALLAASLTAVVMLLAARRKKEKRK